MLTLIALSELMARVLSMKPPAKLAVAQDWWTLRERRLPGQALRITEVRETLTAKPEAVSRME